jgi:hypothetical protein
MTHAGMFKTGVLLALYATTALMAGCVVPGPDEGYGPDQGHAAEHYREGYYDRDHDRWYHDRHWVRCTGDDVHCRG